MKRYKYDIALSFAGEDRRYVSKIAEVLSLYGVRIFYDEYETVNLFGEELHQYLEKVYAEESRYVAIFSSKAYLKSEWALVELKAILHAINVRNDDLILRIKLDETPIEGISDSIGYLVGKEHEINQLCEIIINKLGLSGSILTPFWVLYRVIGKKYLSGDGKFFSSKLFEGRWNAKGVEVFYTATSEEIARNEYLMTGSNELRKDRLVIQYIIPASTSIESIFPQDLPKGWKNLTDGITKLIGSDWAESKTSCILSVPSAYDIRERNYILNPYHPEFKNIVKNKVESLFT